MMINEWVLQTVRFGIAHRRQIELRALVGFRITNASASPTAMSESSKASR